MLLKEGFTKLCDPENPGIDMTRFFELPSHVKVAEIYSMKFKNP